MIDYNQSCWDDKPNKKTPANVAKHWSGRLKTGFRLIPA